MKIINTVCWRDSIGFAIQDSLLTSISKTSSSCTGSFSGEMALAVVEKTVNRSNLLNAPLHYTPIRAHATHYEYIISTISYFF